MGKAGQEDRDRQHRRKRVFALAPSQYIRLHQGKPHVAIDGYARAKQSDDTDNRNTDDESEFAKRHCCFAVGWSFVCCSRDGPGPPTFRKIILRGNAARYGPTLHALPIEALMTRCTPTTLHTPLPLMFIEHAVMPSAMLVAICTSVLLTTPSPFRS